MLFSWLSCCLGLHRRSRHTNAHPRLFLVSSFFPPRRFSGSSRLFSTLSRPLVTTTFLPPSPFRAPPFARSLFTPAVLGFLPPSPRTPPERPGRAHELVSLQVLFLITLGFKGSSFFCRPAPQRKFCAALQVERFPYPLRETTSYDIIRAQASPTLPPPGISPLLLRSSAQ